MERIIKGAVFMVLLVLTLWSASGQLVAIDKDSIEQVYEKSTDTVRVVDKYTLEDRYTVQLISNTPLCLDCYSVYRICNLDESGSLPLSDLLFDFYSTRAAPFAVTGYEVGLLSTVIEPDYFPVSGECISRYERYDNSTKGMISYDYPTTCVVGYEDKVSSQYLLLDAAKTDIPPRTCYDIRVSGKLKIDSSVDNILYLTGLSFPQFAWWNASWSYTVDVNLTNPHTNSVQNYPCNFTFDAATAIGAGKLNANGSDIRIVNNNSVSLSWANSTPLNSASAMLWFRCNITNGTTNPYHLYYGNPLAPTTKTNLTHIRGFGMIAGKDHYWSTGTGSNYDWGVPQANETTAVKMISNSSCLFETCIDLNNGYIRYLANDKYDMSNITYIAWVKLKDTSAINRYASTRNSDNHVGRINYQLESTAAGFYYNYKSGSSYYGATVAVPYKNETWHYIALTRDTTTNNAFYYWDGILRGTYNNAADPEFADDELHYGASDERLLDSSNYYLQESALLDLVLSPHQINNTGGMYHISVLVGSEQASSNDAPIISSIRISPLNPNATQNLQCYVNATDTENTTLRIDYHWLKNGVVQDTGSTSVTKGIETLVDTLLATNTAAFELWNCTASVYDGTTYSTNSTIGVNISNSLPVISGIQITPATAYNTSLLNCSVVVTDYDSAQTLMVTFWWMQNNSIVLDAFNATLSASSGVRVYSSLLVENLTTGFNYTCYARATDAINTTSTVSATRTVSLYVAPYSDDRDASLDLSTIPGALTLFILVVMWLGLLVIGLAFGGFGYFLLGFIVGIFVGFILGDVHPFLTVLMVFMNGLGLTFTFLFLRGGD